MVYKYNSLALLSVRDNTENPGLRTIVGLYQSGPFDYGLVLNNGSLYDSFFLPGSEHRVA